MLFTRNEIHSITYNKMKETNQIAPTDAKRVSEQPFAR